MKKKTNTQGLIYCIDDEPDILDILGEIFEGADFECKTFEKPEELYDAVKKNPPDAVFSDMKMPTDSGVVILEKVKKINPDIPVVFLSGFLDKNTLIDSLNLGVFSALEKPFQPNLVLSMATNAVRYRRLLGSFKNKSINLILYQFSDEHEPSKKSGKDDIRKVIREDLFQLIEIRKSIRNFKK